MVEISIRYVPAPSGAGPHTLRTAGYVITARGHTAGKTGDAPLVCAAVSQVMISLCAAFEGQWGGKDSGVASVQLGEGDLDVAWLSLAGLFLLEKTYPEHLRITVGAHDVGWPKLGRLVESWRRLTLPEAVP